MSAQGRQALLLALLAAAFGGTLWYQFGGTTPAGRPGAASNRTRGAAERSGSVPQVADVKLDALQARNESAGPPTRDPFRFRMKPPPPAPPAPPRPTLPPTQTSSLPPPPPGPPPVPPINLRYVGFAMNANGMRVAMLQDATAARGLLFGRQGDIIEGRYRLLRVEADNLEIAYLDGTGRRRIEKTGQ